jgi:hypothetical protein
MLHGQQKLGWGADLAISFREGKTAKRTPASPLNPGA